MRTIVGVATAVATTTSAIAPGPAVATVPVPAPVPAPPPVEVMAPESVAAPAVPVAPAASASPAASSSSGSSGGSSSQQQPLWQKLTSFKVMPYSVHQNDVVRILVHCPVEANHAIVGSTAFTLKGSWRAYREVGLGLGGKGFGKKGVIISRFAWPGEHEVHMKCVKVTIDKVTHVRKVKLLSSASADLLVREFRIRQFF
ncbi:hypothetical protein [Nonomuraea sp. MG754425]|uniref:hypothetical protein n=1 Tax=Nonomuraea sp. MG754425 TaxID=2570319 RepID=UPI001F3DF046|nr:hypothetical protein [Nonomuraea sp. MG754425]